MTDQELFDHIDPAAIDIHLARNELASYLRTHKTFDPSGGVTSDYDRKFADQLIRGEVNEQNIPHTFADGRIDWFYNPTREDPNLPINNEWQWQLNRMTIIRSRHYEVEIWSVVSAVRSPA